MAEFILTESEVAIERRVEVADRRSRHPARNAIAHLRTAAAIVETDPAMALYRMITAEEEAATAVFSALKHRGYDGADRLLLRDHGFKNALHPFLMAVRRSFPSFPAKSYVFLPNEIAEPARVQLWLPQAPKNYFEPIPPLHFSLQFEAIQQQFAGELDSVARLNKAETIKAHVNKRANLRNRIIYAAPNGIPSVIYDDKFIRSMKNQRAIVFRILTIYLLVEPHAKHQDFVQICLNAFLSMMERVNPRKRKSGGS